MKIAINDLAIWGGTPAFPEKLHEDLGLSKQYDILLVLALGYPAETVVLEEVGKDGDIRYWRDLEGVHHVPKRSVDDLLVSL